MRYKMSTRVVLRVAKSRGFTVGMKAIFDGATGAEIRIEPQPEGSRHEPNPRRLASWDATVLPALRRAMSEHPELRDARVKLERDGGDATFEVKLHGGNWDRTANIRRGRFADIAGDCAALAEAAAAEVAKLRAAADRGDGARAQCPGLFCVRMPCEQRMLSGPLCYRRVIVFADLANVHRCAGMCRC